MSLPPQDALADDPRRWRIVVVLPSKNARQVLAAVVGELRTAFATSGLQPPLIMITDDSSDGTRALARQLRVLVVVGGGRGLGYAMYRGLKAALALAPDVVVSMDADGQSDPSEVMRFLTPIARDEADMVVGSRFLEPGSIRYRYRWRNRLGIKMLARILRWMTGLPLTDSHGGLRAMRPEVVREFDLIGTHTYVQEAIIDAHEKGFRVREVPSVWRPRVHGRSQVVGSIARYVMYTLPVLLIRSGIHVKWLYTAGLSLVVAAVLYFLIILGEAGFNVKGIFLRLPSLVLIALMTMVGIQLFSFGFLAELVKDIKARVDRLDVAWGSPGAMSQPGARAPASGREEP